MHTHTAVRAKKKHSCIGRHGLRVVWAEEQAYHGAARGGAVRVGVKGFALRWRRGIGITPSDKNDKTDGGSIASRALDAYSIQHVRTSRAARRRFCFLFLGRADDASKKLQQDPQEAPPQPSFTPVS